jgi:hypothetical protein
MIFSLEHDIKVTKNHQNLLPTQSVLVAHTVYNLFQNQKSTNTAIYLENTTDNVANFCF